MTRWTELLLLLLHPEHRQKSQWNESWRPRSNKTARVSEVPTRAKSSFWDYLPGIFSSLHRRPRNPTQLMGLGSIADAEPSETSPGDCVVTEHLVCGKRRPNESAPRLSFDCESSRISFSWVSTFQNPVFLGSREDRDRPSAIFDISDVWESKYKNLRVLRAPPLVDNSFLRMPRSQGMLGIMLDREGMWLLEISNQVEVCSLW